MEMVKFAVLNHRDIDASGEVVGKGSDINDNVLCLNGSHASPAGEAKRSTQVAIHTQVASQGTGVSGKCP
jgi:hypothetical protein